MQLCNNNTSEANLWVCEHHPTLSSLNFVVLLLLQNAQQNTGKKSLWKNFGFESCVYACGIIERDKSHGSFSSRDGI